ncbi:MAG TPA: terminase family protein [Bacillota bacterium]|nr:terminase family protein [Bacillota bacterium]
MNALTQFLADVQAIGSPRDQVENFLRAGLILQPRQLLASAAARLCDLPNGPTAVGYGGARGGGKSHWLLAQMGADDCQRVPGLKCLLLRKVGKANLEHFEDLRRHLFSGLKHEFSAHRGILTFANGSRIIAGHFQAEKDIDAYLGLEYDVIGIEEATTLTYRKFQDISTCCRSSKPNWRPRTYSTTNPGGIGHAWYRTKFVLPYLEKREVETRFIPARVSDNAFNNPEYRRVLENLSGWQKRAWLEGDWDIAAGQFFTTFRRDVHVISDFDDTRARDWFAALDYGFTHYTVVLLGCTDADGNTFIVDEHAQRLWLPQRHAAAIKAMLARHHLVGRAGWPSPPRTFQHARPGCLGEAALPGRASPTPPLDSSQFSTFSSQLARFVAGADVFSRQSDGTTIAAQYAREGIRLQPANMDRINGWAEVLQRLGDPAAGIVPRLFIHQRCARLVETLPNLQHDPNRPEDVLKVDADEDGVGGDDAADALRYLVATKGRTIVQRKLRGL